MLLVIIQKSVPSPSFFGALLQHCLRQSIASVKVKQVGQARSLTSVDIVGACFDPVMPLLFLLKVAAQDPNSVECFLVLVWFIKLCGWLVMLSWHCVVMFLYFSFLLLITRDCGWLQCNWIVLSSLLQCMSNHPQWSCTTSSPVLEGQRNSGSNLWFSLHWQGIFVLWSSFVSFINVSTQKRQPASSLKNGALHILPACGRAIT